MRRIILATMAVAFLIAATPAMAQLGGTWAGEGEGACSPPVGTIDFPIYAWQTWKGDIPDSEDEFYGEWYDEDGNYGNFKARMTFSTPEEVACFGKWTWFDTSVRPPREYLMGTFWMRFHKEALTCFGEWESEYSGESGTMTGEKVN